MSCLPARGGAGKQLDSPNVPEGLPCAAVPAEVIGPVTDSIPIDCPQCDYLALLDERVQQIAQAIRDGRDDDSINGLLALETSSHRLGADELSLLAAALRLAVGHHQPDMGVLLSELARAAARLTLKDFSTDTNPE